jgi:replication factor A2
VTVKQLIESEQTHGDAEHTIDGHEVHQVLLVGSITNKSTTATNVSYEIGDGTGYIDVRQWLDTADDDTGKMDGIE